MGKSTVLRELERLGVRVQLEAVDHWTLLEKFYRDPRRFGFAFQVQVLASYANTDEDIQVVERSLDAALQVFVPLSQEAGSITPEDAEELQRIAARLPVPAIDKFVFLMAPVDLCLQRLTWRNRDGEERITREYLQHLEEQYNTFINSLPDSRKVVLHIGALDSPREIADRILQELQR